MIQNWFAPWSTWW